MEDWSIRVRPTIVARLAYLPLYVFAPIAGGCVLLLFEVPIVIAIRGEFSGPVPGWVRILLGLVWIGLSIPGFVLIHRMIRYFLDRARLRLTPTTLYLGGAELPVDLGRVRDVYFVSQHGLGRRKYRLAQRRQFDVLLLVLDDGSLIPLSPPPGQFQDLIPDTYAATTNVAQFLHAIVAILELKVRVEGPLPPEALPFLHPLYSNRLHDPDKPPPTGLRWTLARWTWLF